MSDACCQTWFGQQGSPLLRWNRAWKTLPQNLVDTPAVLIMLDDGNETDYTAAYPIMAARNMVATSYVPTSYVGIAAHITLANLQDLYTAGWAIANHTINHVNLETLSQANQQLEIGGAEAILDGWGLTRASRHVGYPFGKHNADTLLAMTAEGMLTGRLASGGQESLPFADPYLVKVSVIQASTSLATARAYIDAAIAANAIQIFYLHRLVVGTATGYEWSKINFSSLCDYIVHTGIAHLTIDELYDLQSGSLSVRRPRRARMG